MGDLIQTLKAQHNAVGAMVEKINASVSAKDKAEIQSHLHNMAKALLAHLELEDRELYPGFREAASAKQEKSLLTTANMFSTNMGKITDALKAFLQKYDGKQFDIGAFERDWRSITSVLKNRIESEEGSLYPLYEKWVKPTKQ